MNKRLIHKKMCHFNVLNMHRQDKKLPPLHPSTLLKKNCFKFLFVVKHVDGVTVLVTRKLISSIPIQ